MVRVTVLTGDEPLSLRGDHDEDGKELPLDPAWSGRGAEIAGPSCAGLTPRASANERRRGPNAALFDQTAKRRGRPKLSPRAVAADEIIGATVHHLLCWGFPLRRRVAPLVGRLANEVLKRGESGRPLSGARVEQLFEAWFLRHGSGSYDPGFLFLSRHAVRQWTRYTVSSLRRMRPKDYTLEELARTLLQHGGALPARKGDDEYFHADSDLVLTKKAQEKWLRTPRLRRAKETG